MRVGQLLVWLLVLHLVIDGGPTSCKKGAVKVSGAGMKCGRG